MRESLWICFHCKAKASNSYGFGVLIVVHCKAKAKNSYGFRVLIVEYILWEFWACHKASLWRYNFHTINSLILPHAYRLYYLKDMYAITCKGIIILASLRHWT